MLLDHFHPPLVERRHWAAFLLSWAVSLAKELNAQLPDDCFAEPHIDKYDTGLEVVVHVRKGKYLGAEIRLINPEEKSSLDEWLSVIAVGESHLRAGAGWMIVDIVTNCDADLHGQLLQRFGISAVAQRVSLFAASYHPIGRGSNPTLEIWHEPLSIGGALPTMPLYLKNGPLMPVDLSATYQQALKAVRIDPDGG